LSKKSLKTRRQWQSSKCAPCRRFWKKKISAQKLRWPPNF